MREILDDAFLKGVNCFARKNYGTIAFDVRRHVIVRKDVRHKVRLKARMNAYPEFYEGLHHGKRGFTKTCQPDFFLNRNLYPQSFSERKRASQARLPNFFVTHSKQYFCLTRVTRMG
jgi:hypothetical protein